MESPGFRSCSGSAAGKSGQRAVPQEPFRCVNLIWGVLGVYLVSIFREHQRDWMELARLARQPVNHTISGGYDLSAVTSESCETGWNRVQASQPRVSDKWQVTIDRELLPTNGLGRFDSYPVGPGSESNARQRPSMGSRNAAISSPLRTSSRSPTSTGWFQVLPSSAGKRESSLNPSGDALTSASSPSSDRTSSRS